MRTEYIVTNIAGGTVYRGSSLQAAIREAEDGYGDGYVYSKKGDRPVYNGEIGDFGQDLDEFRRIVNNY